MKEINEISVGDFILAYKILKDLSRDWKDFDAYKLELIDDSGKKLKTAESDKEREAVSSYFKIVFNMKRLIQKIVGKTKLARTAVNLLLLKENVPTKTRETIIKELYLYDLGTESDEYIESLVESAREY